MQIKTIQIKNVRGIQNKTIQLNMIPNKPSILVAPNGSGKSSFAFAFQWLNQLRLKLDEDDAFNNDQTNKPELIITTDEPSNNIYIADEYSNQVSKKFGIFVINNGMKASFPGMHNGLPNGKAKIIVPDIVLLERMPFDVNLIDDFEDEYAIDDAPAGLYPSINSLLSNNRFMSLCDYDSLRVTKRLADNICNQIESVKQYKGTIQSRYDSIERHNSNALRQIDPINNAINLIKRFSPKDSEIKLLLKAVKIVTLANRKKDDFKKKVEYARFKINEESTKKLFDALTCIIHKESKGNLIIIW